MRETLRLFATIIGPLQPNSAVKVAAASPHHRDEAEVDWARELLWIAADQARWCIDNIGMVSPKVHDHLEAVQYILSEDITNRAQYLAVGAFIRALMRHNDEAREYARLARSALDMCPSPEAVSREAMQDTLACIGFAEHYETLRSQLDTAATLRDKLRQPGLDPFDKGQIIIRIHFLAEQVAESLPKFGRFLPNRMKEHVSELRSEFRTTSRAVVSVS